MSHRETRFGLSAALAMPFTAEGAIDYPLLAAHAGRCLAGGCDSLTVFGTTGEGASTGLGERERVLGALAGAGVLGSQMVGGVAAAAVTDAVEQARIAYDFGCRALLLAPPFYFKGVDEDGIYAWFARFFERLGGAARDVILYNIPSVTAVNMPLSLILRLAADFPEIVTGVKDSSGDWAYTEKLVAARGGLMILVGDERHLAAAVRLGGEGAISGMANLFPGPLRRLAIEGRDDPKLIELVEAVVQHPVIPAIKALLAEETGEAGWARVRPPLVPLPEASRPALRAAYRRTAIADAA